MKLLSKKKSPSWDQSDTKVLSSMAAVRRGRVHFKPEFRGFELVSGVLCISARALDNLNLEAKAATSSAAGRRPTSRGGARLLSYRTRGPGRRPRGIRSGCPASDHFRVGLCDCQ